MLLWIMVKVLVVKGRPGAKEVTKTDKADDLTIPAG